MEQYGKFCLLIKIQGYATSPYAVLNIFSILFFIFPILSCLDDLKVAKKKANKAKTTNELSSHNEDIRKERIRKKQRNRTRNKRFSDTDDTSLNDSSNDGNIYSIPSFPNLEKSTNGKYYL